ncbi:MAG TPA: hypothetical protein VKZ49_00535, partial [Polyangiaceae bacterium]|nr:hypothetical protein [Polyangiaceae bacterium]
GLPEPRRDVEGIRELPPDESVQQLSLPGEGARVLREPEGCPEVLEEPVAPKVIMFCRAHEGPPV